ncbi:MAG: hypothetical protein ACE5ER_13155, partial [Nitrospinaceae bacterium]
MKGLYLERSLGIDIRDDSVGLCLMGKKLRRLEVIGTLWYEGAAPHPGASVETENEFITRLGQFLQDHGPAADPVVVSLPRRFIPLQTFSLPAPDRQTVHSMVPFEFERHFATTVTDLMISHHVVQEGPNQFRIAAAGLRTETAEYFLDLLSRADIHPAVLDVASFTHLNLLYPEETSMRGVEAVLDLSPGEVDITIVKDGTLELSRTIPFKETSLRKTMHRHDLPREEMDAYVEGLSKTLTEILSVSLNSCTTLEPEDSIDKIHLVGGGTLAEPLARRLEEDTGAVAEPLQPRGETGRHLPSDFDPTLLNTALALALRGLKNLTYEVNLLPREKIPASKRASLRTTLGLSIILVLMAGAYFGSQAAYNRMTLDSLNAQLEEVKQQVGTLEKVDREFEALAMFAKRMN